MSESATPAPVATVTPISDAPKPHHSATQPRADGKFNGPPGVVPPPAPAADVPPPPPTRWKVGDEEFEDPAELARVATERTVDRRAVEKYFREAQEYQQKAAALEAALEAANRGETLDAEAERRIALRVAQRYQQEQEEAALPEEERQIRRQWRAMQAREAAARAELEKYKKEKSDAEAKQRQDAEERANEETRQNLGKSIRSAMEATGLPMNDDLTRMVISEMEAGLHAGVEYPPEVLARRVQRRFYSAANEVVRKEKPDALFKRIPGLVEVLNSLEDPAILRLLAPKLGDKLRRLNLESIGARPEAVPVPTGPAPTSDLIRREDLKPGDDRWPEYFRQQARLRG